MRSRREFITLFGGAAAAWPLAARAQQRALPVIGFINPESPDTFGHLEQAFRLGLRDTGYVEGRNVTIEYRWARGQREQLSNLAAELVDRQVAVVAATGGERVAVAVHAATKSIPIVFTIGGDPVKAGLVTSYNKPGGNVTGATLISRELGPKQVELIRIMVPKVSAVAVLIYGGGRGAESYAADVQAAAQARGQKTTIVSVENKDQLVRAFTTIEAARADVLLVDSDPFFNNLREPLVALAATYRIPTIYAWREIAAVGGLMSYGPSLADAYRQAGIYTGQILKGATPSDLPVVQPTKFELIINLKSARALALDLPQTLFAIADEVIE
jgi:putative ABC transport system substrate-binding protein